MALLWLAVCLTSSVSGLLQTEEDPDSPIKNLRMEPGEKRLTWDLHGNVSEIMCFINSKFITKAINNNRYCQFQVLSSCEVKNFTVSLTKGPPFLMGIQYPLQEGNPGASAQRLDCWVHDMDFLTCSWEVGREAPSDIQYRLYRQHLWTRREQECPHYERDNRGKHVRCHFNDVPRLEKQLQILVRGTSQRATIPCSDRTVELSEIEKLNPPNITGTCNKSYSMMEWKVSSHFNRRYEYELQIQKGSDPAYTEKLQENFFALYNPGNYMARLKVKGFFRNTWSEWSAPQHFVCDVGEDVQRRDWLLSALGVLATLLVLGLAVVLCGRYSVLQKLFPPIPHMKDPTIDNLQSSKLAAKAWSPSDPRAQDWPGPCSFQGDGGVPSLASLQLCLAPSSPAGGLGGQQSKPGGLPGGGSAGFGRNMTQDQTAFSAWPGACTAWLPLDQRMIVWGFAEGEGHPVPTPWSCHDKEQLCGLIL
ncbi:interleukin-3 receptor subunit alpha isoform X1 [Ursus arctos]|uniref:interleukin-3 receptor subunit alpha isoform X1 n=1 Tax=Ursus arctos TaxID=9644 RepID=UPI0025498AD9|nr:interleukin-3 receptor subunit alpha isoform X1 [Ursus arctos]